MTANSGPPPFPKSQPADQPSQVGLLARPARKRTYLKGKIVYGNGDFTLDCVIQDLSESGAKIIFDQRQALPTDVYLIVVKQGVAYKASVVWHKFPARGLKFVETYKLDMPLPADVQFLHRLWVDLCARTTAPSQRNPTGVR